jgi:hypothetical protein
LVWIAAALRGGSAASNRTSMTEGTRHAAKTT